MLPVFDSSSSNPGQQKLVVTPSLGYGRSSTLDIQLNMIGISYIPASLLLPAPIHNTVIMCKLEQQNEQPARGSRWPRVVPLVRSSNGYIMDDVVHGRHYRCVFAGVAGHRENVDKRYLTNWEGRLATFLNFLLAPLNLRTTLIQPYAESPEDPRD